MLFKDIIGRIYVLFCILLFSYTGLEKIIQFDDFQFNIAKTELVRLSFVKWVSSAVILVEFLVVVCLIFFKKNALQTVLLFFTFSTLYILILDKYSKYSLCGCGGILNTLKFEYHLGFNLLMIFIAVYLILND